MKTRRTLKRSKNGEEINLETIPLDLVIEILLKLPVKPIARFRCVSKLWESTIRSLIFTEPFFTISSSRPKLLFTCLEKGETFFFTSQRPHDSSTTLTASFQMKFPINYCYGSCRPVRGLVCGLNHRTLEENMQIIVPLVCHPSTGQILTLPEVKIMGKGKRVLSHLGYDPIDNKFKVLFMTKPEYRRFTEDHQVLTLGTGKKLSWRMIKCGIRHRPIGTEHRKGHCVCVYDVIGINGVLYYLALVDQGNYPSFDIVCFDIKSEKFKSIRKVPALYDTVLVNHKGKLAILHNTCTRIRLWVLEDSKKDEWLSYIDVTPPSWKQIFKRTFYSVGTTTRGEIVLSPTDISESFYLLYYNPESKIITRVEIQGMEAFKPHQARIFLDHVEDLKLMESA